MRAVESASAILVTMVIAVMCLGCTGVDGIGVPEEVLRTAETQVQQLFRTNRAEYPSYCYTDWRIENLVYSYTYDDLDGMKITIYQMNYEFLTKSPENIVPVGGMYITEDNWVMPGYPNSVYLVFRQEGERLNFLKSMVENDCSPGTTLFTQDLLGELSEGKGYKNEKTICQPGL